MQVAVVDSGRSVSVPDRVARHRKLSCLAKLVYGQVAGLSRLRGYCWASNRYLGEYFGKSPDSIRRCIGELERAGFLVAERDARDPLNQKRKLRVASPPIGAFDGVPAELPGGTGRNAGGVPAEMPGRVPAEVPGNSLSLSVEDEEEGRPVLKPVRREAELSRAALVSLCRDLAGASRERRAQAPVPVSRAVREVVGGWSQAGALPVREWPFLGPELHDKYRAALALSVEA